MKLIFSEHAWRDYLYRQTQDKASLLRINTLIKEIIRCPSKGIGKPEPLKHALAGYWSRRINEEHHIVYKVTDDAVLIAQLRHHH